MQFKTVLVVFNQVGVGRKPVMRKAASDFSQGNPADGLREYAYKTDIDLAVNDYVVVKSGGYYKVVQVTKVRGLTHYQENQATSWIVCKINTAAHEERLRKQEIAQEIKNKLRKRKEEMEEIMVYKMLAKEDPSIKALLQELGQADETYLIATDNDL